MFGASARPVIRPRMGVVDHGKVFNSEHFDDVCRMLGINGRPGHGAHRHRQGHHREHLHDLKRRGKHGADGPLWSLNRLQDLLDEWIVQDRQQKPHAGLRRPSLPGLTISPNRMYATLVAAEGPRADAADSPPKPQAAAVQTADGDRQGRQDRQP
ncbi:hypothetical protein I2W78_39400 [Streptomyces spinoverrucosus]|uniref:hypothetical protein n=1 Tax=Streptomyces spinoverrucosus TaxID=284043 RepID=UPI0018C3F5EF|nr:hypothetical protein [Streptomyces spinoverrucosus]MBG0857752.1 hypothetical protein [Streptomyces spinoverrucosus]